LEGAQPLAAAEDRSTGITPTVEVNANSDHINGVNLVLCDGSVRFVTNSISLPTWRALGTRALGETLGSDW
jgi:prepilin-type processing-associated H-X9-DG protein